MMIRKGKRNTGQTISMIIILLNLFPVFLFSQTTSLQISVNKTDILIGEQVRVKIKAIIGPGVPASGYTVMIPDSISHFEIIDKGKTDSVDYKDNSRAVEQTIIVTSFDSGKWTIPGFRINFAGSTGDSAKNRLTDPITIHVSYSPADSTNQLHDIKPLIEVSVMDYTWYYIGAGILLLSLAVFFLTRFLKKNNKIKPVESKSGISPLQEAMLELLKLKQYDLVKPVEIKLFHTKLGEIFKRYMGRRQGYNLMSMTSGDILINTKSAGLASDGIASLATALRCGDAVKFAKYLPSVEESEDCLSRIRQTIQIMEPLSNNQQT